MCSTQGCTRRVAGCRPSTDSVYEFQALKCSLIAHQLEDDSLIDAGRNGKEEKDGFSFNENGLLTHTKTSDLGKLMVRIVMPKC